MNDFLSSYPNAFVISNRILYTASSFARSSLLFLQEAGTLEALVKHTSSRDGLSSYLFMLVLSGEGQVDYKGKVYSLSQGDCAFLDCQASYSHTTASDLWTLSWVHFNGPEMKSVFDKYRARGGQIVFHPESGERYKDLLDKLINIAKGDSYIKDMEINAILAELLVYLMEDSWNPELSELTGKRKNIIKVREYLERNYDKDISLESLAELFFMNKTYLAELFKEQYGSSIIDYLTSVRITAAKKLLRFTEKTMEEISCEIGLHSAAYFSRMFKKVEGISPSHYRNTW